MNESGDEGLGMSPEPMNNGNGVNSNDVADLRRQLLESQRQSIERERQARERENHWKERALHLENQMRMIQAQLSPPKSRSGQLVLPAYESVEVKITNEQIIISAM